MIEDRVKFDNSTTLTENFRFHFQTQMINDKRINLNIIIDTFSNNFICHSMRVQYKPVIYIFVVVKTLKST